MQDVCVIWFKDDLRVHDHAALRRASQIADQGQGVVLPLFIYPVSFSKASRVAESPRKSVDAALSDLDAALRQRGAQLHIREGEPLEVLSRLHADHHLVSLYTHSSERRLADLRALKSWALRAGVQANVLPQFFPLERIENRSDWFRAWESYMSRPRFEAPDKIHGANLGGGEWRSEHNVDPAGGRKHAIFLLREILSVQAHRDIATENVASITAFEQLRRHLDLGVVSVREVWQAAMAARHRAKDARLRGRTAYLDSFCQCLVSYCEPISFQRRASRIGPFASHRETGQQLSLRFD